MSSAHYLPCGHWYDVVPSWGCQKCSAGLPPDTRKTVVKPPPGDSHMTRVTSVPPPPTIQNGPSNEVEKSVVKTWPCGHLRFPTVSWHQCKDGCFSDEPLPVSSPQPEAEKQEAEPAHYKSLTPEPIAVIMAWGLTFTLGNVVKYIARAGRKEGSPALSDLKKARRYIDFEIERLEGK